MPDHSFSDKVALLTGSSGFWAETIARVLAEAGVDVWLHDDLNSELLNRLYRQIREAGGNAHTVTGDLTKPEEARRVIGEVIDRAGRLDILVNQAEKYELAALADIGPESWERILAYNLDTAFLCSKEAVPYMAEKGSGYVVNISSAAAFTGEIGPHYASSKSAMNSLTKALSGEYGKQGVRIRALAPSAVQPDFEHSAEWKDKQTRVKQAVARMVLVCCSSYGDYLSSDAILLDGGESIG